MKAIFVLGLFFNILMAFWIRGEVNQDTLRIPKNIQYLTWDRRKVTSVTWEEQAPTRFLAFSINSTALMLNLSNIYLFSLSFNIRFII